QGILVPHVFFHRLRHTLSRGNRERSDSPLSGRRRPSAFGLALPPNVRSLRGDDFNGDRSSCSARKAVFRLLHLSIYAFPGLTARRAPHSYDETMKSRI